MEKFDEDQSESDSHKAKPKLAEGIRFIDENNIREKIALVRVDFNVPKDETGQIIDDRRIRAVLPTINHLLDERCKVILLSHMGRPKGKIVQELSLSIVSKRLSRLLEKEVLFVDDCIGEKVKNAVKSDYEIILLENVRFHEGETKDDINFAKLIKDSTGANIYVNDAFAVSHRKHASVHSLAKLFDKKDRFAGILMKKELLAMERIFENPRKPFAAIVGGVKVSDKIGALRNLLNLVDKLLIGGAMAFTFLEAQGIKVGKSIVEQDYIETAKVILDEAKRKGIKLYLPVDCVVARSIDGDEEKVVPVQEIPPDYAGFDIGPATIVLFSEVLKDARTIIWNGPMGVFEKEQFSKGTYSMVSILANSTAFTVVGGGDTDVAVSKMGEQHRISYISTGGGAFIEILEGKELPGIAALRS